MKLSNTWFALILIASALLLSGARNVTAEGPSEPDQRSQTETPAQDHDALASPSPTIINQPAPQPTPNAGATYIYNQYKQSSPLGDLPTWLEAIATILLVIFAGRQMQFVSRSTTATENAANAASENAKAAKDAAVATERYVEMTAQMVEATKQSAKATEAALHINRPFLLVTRILNDDVFHDGSTDTVWHNYYFRLELRNFGVGPADIVDFIAKAEPLNSSADQARRDPAVWYGPNEGDQINDSLIAPSEITSERISIPTSLNDASTKRCWRTPRELQYMGGSAIGERQSRFIAPISFGGFSLTKWAMYLVPRVRSRRD
jgi:hypothetical protein